MNDEDAHKPAGPPDEIRPVEGAEVEYLDVPPAAEAKPGRGKPRKKDSGSHPGSASKDQRREVEDLKTALRELEEKAAARESESAALRDNYLRLAAEMDNQRKRLEREKSDYFQYALAEWLRDVLQVTDNFERALKTGETADGPGFREGVELIHKQLLELLRRQGVVPIVRGDRRFDPQVHHAVVTEESPDVDEAVVGEELQRGYLLNDRLLRPAMVKVLLPKKD
ncbi:MAG: nucleotide exchange factor GrpE [Candidatus Aminicenantes bacterium]|nr:nucleotide exchange factor GrpE [Candidatus Aminicenantes bacterium]